MKYNRSFSASRFSGFTAGIVILSACVFEVLPVLAQEYGGNITPPPPRPRRAYSTMDTYNYTHGGGDTTYSDSYKKPRRVKKIRKMIKSRIDDAASKITTTPGANGHSKNGATDSAASPKSDHETSSASTKSEKPDVSVKSDRSSKVPDSTSESDTSETSAAETSSSKSKGSETSSDTASESTDSDASTKATATEDGSKDQDSGKMSGSKLSSVPPPQMPPPPTSIGGFAMKGSSK